MNHSRRNGLLDLLFWISVPTQLASSSGTDKLRGRLHTPIDVLLSLDILDVDHPSPVKQIDHEVQVKLFYLHVIYLFDEIL